MYHSSPHSSPPAAGRSKFLTLFGTGFTHGGSRIGPMDQFPIDLGANRSFNDGVLNIAQNARLCSEFHPIAGLDVAFDDAVQDDVGRCDRALYAAMLAHGQEGALFRVAPDVAVHMAIDMQAAGEFDVAIDSGLRANQGVDGRVFTLAFTLFEHLPHPWPDCRLPRFPPTSPAPSKRRPAENCGSRLCRGCCESPPRRAWARTPAAVVRVRRNPESNGRSMPG